jgi:hypothetical protein
MFCNADTNPCMQVLLSAGHYKLIQVNSAWQMVRTVGRCKTVFTASMNSSLVRPIFSLPLLVLTTLAAAVQCCAKLVYPTYNPGKQCSNDSMPDTVGMSSSLRGACHCNLVPSSLIFRQIESCIDCGIASHARVSSHASTNGCITCTVRTCHLKEV